MWGVLAHLISAIGRLPQPILIDSQIVFIPEDETALTLRGYVRAGNQPEDSYPQVWQKWEKK